MLNVPSEKSMDKLLANIHQDKIITASTIGKCLDMFFLFMSFDLDSLYLS